MAPPSALQLALPSVWLASEPQWCSPSAPGAAAPQLPPPQVAEPELASSLPLLALLLELPALVSSEPPHAERPRAVEAARTNARRRFWFMARMFAGSRPSVTGKSERDEGENHGASEPSQARMLHAMSTGPRGALAPLLVLLGGCSCGPAVPSAPSTPSPASAETTASEPGDYEVHEWGLVRGIAGDRLVAGAIGPPPVVLPMVVDKPVLYFHTTAPLTLEAVRVHASGAIVEAWPLTARTGVATELAWMRVAIDPHPSACEPTPLPTECGAPVPCEVPSLARVRTAESPCLRVGEVTDTMLFYRSFVDGMTPPLLFSRAGGDAITVRHDGDEPIEGRLVRIRSVMGQVLTSVVDPPAPHESVVVGADFGAAMDEDGDMPALPGGPEPGRAAVRASLLALGLTDEEAAAFLRAWDGALFGLAVADGEVADHRTMDSLSADETDGIPAPVDSFLYFLPPSSVAAISTLELEPAPRAVRRAIAMWSIVPPRGSSR